MKLPQFCIRRPVFTAVLSFLIVVVGIISFLRLPVRGYPKINPPVVTVRVYFPGASASIMESQVTTPIENDLVGLSGLRTMHSTSRQGYSRISLHFKLKENINDAVSDVRNKLAKVSEQLPQGAQAPVIQKRNPNSLQTLVLSLSDRKLSALALTDYANRYVLPKLQEQLGVANVEVYNARDYAMKILLHPELMAANHVTVNDLIQALQAQNQNVPSGEIRSSGRSYSVLAQGQLHSVKGFRSLVIKNEKGYLLRFGDVANIKVGAENTESAMRVNGEAAVGIGIYAQATANPIAVAKRVAHSLHRLRQSLPAGMKLSVVWNDTHYLKASLAKVYEDIIIALVLVALIVLLFLGSIRSTFVPIITVPICLIGVCALIWVLGYSINIFTLLALVLAIGLVVDDAIVMLENIYRHREQGLSGLQAALKGSGEIAFAIIAMTLTLAAVYAPIGFATGMTGIIFRQFAYTLALAVILSGFIALTLSPMLCARVLQLPQNQQGWAQRYSLLLQHMFQRLIQWYQQSLQFMLQRRWIVVLLLLLFLGVGYACFRSLPSSLAPKEDMGAFLVSIRAPSNASFQYINRYSKKVEHVLREMSAVATVMMMVNPTYGGFAFVILKPRDQRHLSSQQVMHRFHEKTRHIAGIKVGAFNMSRLGGGGRYGNSLRLAITTDASFKSLHQTVKVLLNKLMQYPGIASAAQDLRMDDKQYVVTVNRNLAADLQVSMESIDRTLKTMLGGAKVTSFNWDNRDYDVILEVPEHALTNVNIVNQLYVRSQTGQMIPLANLIKIKQQVGPQLLPHEDRLRANTVTATLASGYTLGQAIQHAKRLAKSVLPNGYQFHFKGAARRLLRSRTTMAISFGLALLFIYLVLAAQFESFIDPFIIIFSVPLSIVGALFTLWLTGHPMSIYTNIGLVTLVGLIAKHGILITEFTNQKRRQGMTLESALVEAATQRLRPILMTTAAMVCGAIPLALAGGAGALARQDIGWVIVGGMTLGTFFSLIVVPVAYSFLGKYKKIVLATSQS